MRKERLSHVIASEIELVKMLYCRKYENNFHVTATHFNNSNFQCYLTHQDLNLTKLSVRIFREK